MASPRRSGRRGRPPAPPGDARAGDDLRPARLAAAPAPGLPLPGAAGRPPLARRAHHRGPAATAGAAADAPRTAASRPSAPCSWSIRPGIWAGPSARSPEYRRLFPGGRILQGGEATRDGGARGARRRRVAARRRARELRPGLPGDVAAPARRRRAQPDGMVAPAGSPPLRQPERLPDGELADDGGQRPVRPRRAADAARGRLGGGHPRPGPGRRRLPLQPGVLSRHRRRLHRARRPRRRPGGPAAPLSAPGLGRHPAPARRRRRGGAKPLATDSSRR